jgi:type I restriction enzyme M protein
MDAATLGNWLWDAAYTIRGSLDTPKLKDCSLPLVFMKRLPEVFDDEIEHLAQEFSDRDSGNQGSNGEWDVRRMFVEGDLVTRWRKSSVRRRCRG